jgi:penicillin amidase
MKRGTRGLMIAGITVGSLALLLFGAWLVLTRLPYPKTRGAVRLEGLSGPAEILRDRYGVPHIYARTAEDLFFAQGYAHAQDRFWQMEFWRRVGAGRLSELFGKSLLETDKFLRTLGLHEVAQREYELMPPDTRRYLDAYVAGVNAYALERPPWRLALELTLLRLQGVKFAVEPWTPADSIAWGKMMAYDLGTNFEEERSNLEILGGAGRRAWGDYFSPYRSDMPYIVSQQELAQGVGLDPMAQGADSIGAQLACALPACALPAWARGAVAAGPFGTSGKGSNSWVISGERTASGKPLLANDMHLGIQMPSVWYEVGLHGIDEQGNVGRTERCPFDVRGYSFPGVPFVIAGHNDRIAWGFTNQGGDVQDLYVERLNPENPDQYEVNGRWVDMEIRYETIKINKEDEPYVLRVRKTRHGPLLTDRSSWRALAAYAVSPGKPFPQDFSFTGLALRWTALEPTRLVEAVCRLDQASGYADFREALRRWDIAHQNVVYADVEGNIAYQATGLIPVRAQGDGRAPVPGWTDEYEWLGYVPFEQMPAVLNPAKGYMVTANNPPVAPEYPRYLGSQFSMGYRARRISELIEADRDGITIEDMKRIQGDVYDQAAAETVPYLRGLDLRGALESRQLEGQPKPPGAAGQPEEQRSERERLKQQKQEQQELQALEKARERLLGWDARMKRDSPEAALYGFFWLKLVEETFKDQFPESAWPPGEHGRLQSTLYTLLQQPDDPWWDDLRTPDTRESRDEILVRAFGKGYRATVERLGKRMDSWRWGKLLTAEFRNATLGESGIGPIERIFNRGPVQMQGGNTQVNTAHWSVSDPFKVIAIVSEREIVDLGDLAGSLSVHSTGQSGHPTNRHYDDFIEPWRNVQYHSTLWERAQVEAASRQRLRLLPAQR